MIAQHCAEWNRQKKSDSLQSVMRFFYIVYWKKFGVETFFLQLKNIFEKKSKNLFKIILEKLEDLKMSYYFTSSSFWLLADWSTW